jgi:hypothetical protein
MTRTLAAFVAAVALSIAPTSAVAQAKAPKPLSFGDLVEQRAPTPSAAAQAGFPCTGLSDEARRACLKWQQSVFDHQVWVIEYRQKAYEAHHIYTMIVFAIVCGLVLLGMYLSYKEFDLGAKRRQTLLQRLARRLQRPATTTPKEGQPVPPAEPQQPDDVQADVVATQLELSTSGIKVTSQVLGVIVLIVSMGFFYLYLKTVYPIQENTAASTQATTPTALEAESGETKK